MTKHVVGTGDVIRKVAELAAAWCGASAGAASRSAPHAIRPAHGARALRTAARAAARPRRSLARGRVVGHGEHAPSPGTPFSSCSPWSANSMTDPTTRSLTVPETSTSPGAASAPMRAPMWTAIPRDVGAAQLAFAGVDAGPRVEPE